MELLIHEHFILANSSHEIGELVKQLTNLKMEFDAVKLQLGIQTASMGSAMETLRDHHVIIEMKDKMILSQAFEITRLSDELSKLKNGGH